MAFRRADDRPFLISVPITEVHNTLWVYQHFPQHPPFPLRVMSSKHQEQYAIEQAYTRYEWALNFLDPSRWEDTTRMNGSCFDDMEQEEEWETGAALDMSDLRSV